MMPEITTIHDKDSDMLPHVDELRASQKKGAQGKGMNDPDCQLNQDIGMQVDIQS